jgi:hypothetical protein
VSDRDDRLTHLLMSGDEAIEPFRCFSGRTSPHRTRTCDCRQRAEVEDLPAGRQRKLCETIREQSQPIRSMLTALTTLSPIPVREARAAAVSTAVADFFLRIPPADRPARAAPAAVDQCGLWILVNQRFNDACAHLNTRRDNRLRSLAPPYYISFPRVFRRIDDPSFTRSTALA